MDPLSSLLVQQDVRLVPASSAQFASSQQRVVAKERVREAATAEGPEEVRTQTTCNVINPQKRPRAHVHHETLDSSSRAKRQKSTKGLRPVQIEIDSSPSTLESTAQNKLDQAYSVTTTRRDQHPPTQQDCLPVDDNMPPPSVQLACADLDMLRGGGHDLGLTHPDDYLEEEDPSEFESGPLEGLQSMAEYEKAYPYTPPPPKGVARRFSGNNGKYSSEFQMAADERGLKIEFDFREKEKGRFWAWLKVNNELLGEVGPYASKKDAKEASCKENLSKLEAYGNLKKRKSSGQKDILSLTPKGFEDENWIGILNSYLQTKQLPTPEYGPSGVHPSMGPWFCTVRFKGSPLTPFGYGMGPFGRKNEAKKVAAMEAVQWLRQEGKLDHGTKRRKSDGFSTSPGPGDTGLTQSVKQLEVQPPQVLTNRSLAQQVHDAALRLGFTQPAFPTQQLDGSFVNMCATFNPNDANREPRLAGEVCKVGPVFGKKPAKEECCRELLRLLDKIEQSRQSLI